MALVTIDCPDRANALGLTTLRELANCVERADQDDAISAIVITGEGSSFCSGADLRESLALVEDAAGMLEATCLWARIEQHVKPMIAAVNGPASGAGLELVLVCDLAFASSEASFSLPELAIGSLPGGGGSQRLIRSVGAARAFDMILGLRSIDALQAESWGLVSRRVEPDQLLNESMKAATIIAHLATPAVQEAKRLLRISQDTLLSRGLDDERAAFLRNMQSAHFRRGCEAFLSTR